MPKDVDANDVEPLLASLNRSAERLQTLWISFILYCFYLAIAASGTTHRMLLQRESINLPVVDLGLPLIPFYLVAPFTLVVFHFYLLMMLVLLARTAHQFNQVLEASVPPRLEQERIRFRIENSLFLQMVAGAADERTGWNGRWLQMVAMITVVIAPIAVLLITQAMFLPYHSSFVTWFHRILVVVDLLLVLVFWPSFRWKGGEGYWPRWNWGLAHIVPACLLVLFGSIAALTYPGETVNRRARLVFPSAMMTHCQWDYYLPPNCLYLPGEDFVDSDKLNEAIADNRNEDGSERWQPTIDLRNRDLSDAILTNVDLRHSDLSGASSNLANANLNLAWLTGAHFENADMSNTQLDGAELKGTRFSKVTLRAASLKGANLQGANLESSELQAADLSYSNLIGANIREANGEGLILNGAHLQFADLYNSHLEVAELTETNLTGANLVRANLTGASLNGTSFVAAKLTKATIAGALVDGSDFSLSDISDLNIYRSFYDVPPLMRNTFGDQLENVPDVHKTSHRSQNYDMLTVSEYHNYVEAIKVSLPTTAASALAEVRLAKIRPNNQTRSNATEVLLNNNKKIGYKTSRKEYNDLLWPIFLESICTREISTFVAKSLFHDFPAPRFTPQGVTWEVRLGKENLVKLVVYLQKEKNQPTQNCSGASLFTAKDFEDFRSRVSLLPDDIQINEP